MPTIDAEGRDISLLYVEDEQDARDMLSEVILFRYPDVRLLVADNGNTGLESFKQYRPEIVITDIYMPVCNGIRMAAEIKALSSSTEIIALTAHTDTQYLMQAIEIGINNYILKPINIEQILEVIDKTVAIIRSSRVIEQQNSLIRQLNAELVQKAEDLERANRELESYDYSVAHDLHSPIIAIRDFSRRLLDTQTDNLDSAGRGCLQSIHLEAIRVNSLIDALLIFSVRARKFLVKKWTDMSAIALEISRNFNVTGPRRVTFQIKEGVNGYCDPDLMRIVLENLLGNAWKYSFEKDDVLIEFGTLNREDDLVYFIRDNGSGFDENEVEKIFAPFHRLESNGQIEGFGIGLATSYRIINRHGGRIWAEAERGKGATFYFTL